MIAEGAMDEFRHNGGPPLDDDDNGTPSRGYIRVWREIREHEVVGFGKRSKPADPYNEVCYNVAEAWLDLIMQCNYRDSTVTTAKGHVMTIKRGQVLGAVSWLAARWNWTPKAVRVFLDRLEDHNMMVRANEMNNGQSENDPLSTEGNQKGNQKGNHEGNQKGVFKGNRPTVLSICNYDVFQHSVNDKGQPEFTPQGQPEGQLKGQPKGQHLNNVLNNVLNNSSESVPPSPQEGVTPAIALQAEARAMEASAAEAVKPAEPDKPKRRGRAPQPKTSIPQDWVMPAHYWSWAMDTYVISREDLIREATNFKNRNLRDCTKYSDWFAAWKNWMGSDFKKHRLRNTASAPIADLTLLDTKPEPERDEHAEAIERARAMMMEDDDG